jgi:hypothetical protein
MGVHKRVDSARTTAPKAGGSKKARQRWQHWGNALRKRELQDLAAWLLEATSPLALIGAQLLYIGIPFFGGSARDLARLLESEEDRQEFIHTLRSNTIDMQGSEPGARP